MVSERRGPSRRKFQAAIRNGRRVVYLGVYPTKEERDIRVKQAQEERAERRARLGFDDRFVPDEDPFVPTPRLTGAMRLCAAVLVQACDDLRGKSAQRRRAAREWILSDAVGGYSFRFCCDVLEMGIEETREHLLRGETAWQREPSAPLTLVKRTSAEN